MYLTFLIAVPVLLCINSANAALMKTFEDSFHANHVYWDGSSVNMAGSGWDGLMNPPFGGRVEVTDGQLKMIIPDGLNVGYSDIAPLLYKSVTGNFEAICKVYEPWIDSIPHVSYCLAAQYPDNSENWVIGLTQPVWEWCKSAMDAGWQFVPDYLDQSATSLDEISTPGQYVYILL